MLRRNRQSRSETRRIVEPTSARSGRSRAFRPLREMLEDRRLMTASLQVLPDLPVPALQGTVVALDGSGTTDAQTFTVSSSNPDIVPSIPTGPFWTINVNYTDPQNAGNDFSGPLTFQLFQSLTPKTVSEIQTFTNDGYYTGKTFHRVASGFPDATGYVLQAGAPNPDGSGNSGQPGTPYVNEPVQTIPFTGKYQLGIANSGANTNDTQFFITTKPVNNLSYAFTMFGQLVSGVNTVTSMTKVPVMANPALGGEKSRPVNPLVMSRLSFSSTNPNGSLILDTSQAKAGEKSTITVTATDTKDHTTQTQTFVVTLGAYSAALDPAINFRPLASPVALIDASAAATPVTLAGQSTYPDPSFPSTLTYALVTQPTHGTITQFSATAGTFTYTPNAGFTGTESFQYQVSSTGPNTGGGTLTSNPAAVTISLRGAIGDYTGVGHAQLAVFRPATAQWFALGPNGGQALNNFGDTDLRDIPAPGDYLATGHSQEAVFRPATDEWFVNGPNGTVSLGVFGGPGDIPVPGDYLHLGHVQQAVFRPSTAHWFVKDPGTGKGRQLLNINDPSGAFGAIDFADVPVPGDYDGLGYTEMAIFRPATAQWFVYNPVTNKSHKLINVNNSNGGFGQVDFADVPVPGDYDGIGYTEMAIFRPATAQWFVYNPVTRTSHQVANPKNSTGSFGLTNFADVPASGPTASLRHYGII